DPRFLSLLTLTVIPGTPIARLEERGGFALPSVPGLLRELRLFVAAERYAKRTGRLKRSG
ncbi:MAG: hypothetical protein AAB114_07225, partial [Chloroflexota bacterium]